MLRTCTSVSDFIPFSSTKSTCNTQIYSNQLGSRSIFSSLKEIIIYGSIQKPWMGERRIQMISKTGSDQNETNTIKSALSTRCDNLLVAILTPHREGPVHLRTIIHYTS